MKIKRWKERIEEEFHRNAFSIAEADRMKLDHHYAAESMQEKADMRLQEMIQEMMGNLLYKEDGPFEGPEFDDAIEMEKFICSNSGADFCVKLWNARYPEKAIKRSKRSRSIEDFC